MQESRCNLQDGKVSYGFYGKIAVPKARLSAGVTMSLNEKRRWFFIAKYSEKYKDKEGDIKWLKDTQRSFALGVKYTF